MTSLTEAARAVLEGKVLEEGLPTVTGIAGGVSNPDPVDPSTASTGNAKTLRPGSGTKEDRFANPGAEPATLGYDDLGGATPTSVATDNLGAKAAGKTGKDKSRSSVSAVGSEPAKKLAAMAEEMEDEGDIVEEGAVSISERVKMMKRRMEEARKMKKHDDDNDDRDMDEEIEISEELEDFVAGAIEAGLNEEEILAAIDENFEFVTEDSYDNDIAEAMTDYQVDMSEHVNALLAGENLSEDFHEKATTIFEAAVKAKLEEEVALLEQAYAETLEERVAQIEEELTSQVDDYLNYVVEQWIEENEVAVESALRSELTEDFISGLRALFAEHYIDVPEESVPVVEELSSTVEDLEAKLNEEIQRNVELTSMLSESRKVELTSYVCEGLTSTQAEKLKTLAEGVDYTSDEEFIEKVATLRENYFSTAVKGDESISLVESTDSQNLNEENLEGPMGKYVKALGRSLPR